MSQLNTGPSAAPKRPALSLRMSTALFFVMVVAFVVAVIFAANSSTLVGWLVVVVAGGWLAIFTYLVLFLRGAARKAEAAFTGARNDFSRAAADRAPVAGTSVVGERDSLLDQKLDHSFKIIQVQKRVVAEERAKGAAGDAEMIERALETIEITASNARDMLKSSSSGAQAVSGVVIEG